MSTATLAAPAGAAQEFAMPYVSKGMSVLYTPNHGNALWYNATVNRVANLVPLYDDDGKLIGYDRTDQALELIVFLTDGEVGRDESASSVTYQVRDNVRHRDDPFARTEHYITNVLNDRDGDVGGLWKHTELTERFLALEAAMDDLVQSRPRAKAKSEG